MAVGLPAISIVYKWSVKQNNGFIQASSVPWSFIRLSGLSACHIFWYRQVGMGNHHQTISSEINQLPQLHLWLWLGSLDILPFLANLQVEKPPPAVATRHIKIVTWLKSVLPQHWNSGKCRLINMVPFIKWIDYLPAVTGFRQPHMTNVSSDVPSTWGMEPPPAFSMPRVSVRTVRPAISMVAMPSCNKTSSLLSGPSFSTWATCTNKTWLICNLHSN